MSAKRKPQHPVLELPFVADRPGRRTGRSFWAVKPAGNYTDEWQQGQEMALAYMAWQRKQHEADPDMSNSMGPIIAEMIRAGDTSGVPLGFFSTIVDASMGHWHPVLLDRLRQFYDERKKEADAIIERKRRKAS